MDTVKAGDLIDAVIRWRGWEPSAYTLSMNQRQTLSFAIDDAVRRAWGYQMWPQLMRVERRQFRPGWRSDYVYSVDAEVFHGDGYWRATHENSNSEPGAGSEFWESCRPIPFIEFNQPWEWHGFNEEGVDLNFFAFADDPRQRPNLPAIKGCSFWMDSVVLPDDAPGLVYIRFKPNPPVISYDEWSSSNMYDVGDVVYQTASGRCYLCIKAVVNPGVPLSQTDTWKEQRVPRMFMQYVVRWACAQWLTRDEGRYEEEAAAQQILEDVARSMIERRGGDGTPARIRVAGRH